MNELMSYQKNLIVTPFGNDVKSTYSYNWKEYFYNILANKELSNTVREIKQALKLI